MFKGVFHGYVQRSMPKEYVQRSMCKGVCPGHRDMFKVVGGINKEGMSNGLCQGYIHWGKPKGVCPGCMSTGVFPKG